MKAWLSAVLVLGLAAFATGAPPTGSGDNGKADNSPVEIPVTRIVLFTSGVGYFQHDGTVDGDADVRLSLKTSQMNDVLKSLIVMAESSHVASVTYPSSEPLSHALKGFAVDLSDDPSMADLLQQLRGVEVVVDTPQALEGRIVSVESHQEKVVSGGTTSLVKRTYLNLFTGDKLVSIPVDSIQSIEPSEKRLQDEFHRALALLGSSRDTERKNLDIRFTGKGESAVRIGYITETPVWRASYRLDLSGAKEAQLQGWAHIENTSDEDWSNVSLSLVSGRPISFIEDLYTALYVPRPVVTPQLYSALRPRQYQQGIQEKAKRLEAAERRMRRSMDRGGPPRSGAPARPQAKGGGYFGGRAATKDALARGVEALAAGARTGELFSYTVKEPVNLPRRQSAMIPIIQTKVAEKKVSIYNESVLSNHPLNGAYLTNSTDMTMPPGPITVFDDGTYAGDARIGSLKPGEKRLISYAVDLAVTVDPSEKTSSSLVGGKIVDGTLVVEHKQLYTHTYRIKSSAHSDRTLLIEQRYVPGRELVEPAHYTEKTARLYRFEVPVKKGSTGTFTVQEQQVVSQRISILSYGTDSLLYYSRSGQIPDKVQKALAKAVAMKQTLSRLQQQERDLQSQLQRIESGQERLRKNIETVGRDSQLGERYLKKLGTQEDQIESINGKIDDLRSKIATQRKELSDYLDGLNVG